MMKKLKLFLATLLALVFAFSAGKVKAYDITVDNGGSGTYESYRIFTGTLSEDGKTLSNIKWGDGITEAGRTALQEKYKVSSAAALAEVIGAEGFTATQAEEFAKEAGQYLQNPGGLTGLTAGYYLVQNKTVGSNEAYTNYILEVVGNVTVTPKTDIPTLEKKVKDTDDTTGEVTDWQDSADYDFDDDVPFQLTVTLPSNFNSYDNYYFEISDTLSSGLTYNKDAKVYLVNDGQKTDVTEKFTIGTANGLSFKIDNLKAISGVTASSKIVVEYTATLNKSAVIGKIGNPNTAKLIYSNNPNSRGTAGSTTETPEDTVIVFTYKVVVNKVDENSKPLAGAEFTLYKKLADGSQKAVTAIKNDAGTTFEFKGLDAGDYILSETTTPNGYNTIDDIEFTITAEHDVLSDTPALKSLSGNAASGDITFTSAVTEGSVSTDVVNKKGATLPSTGGTGTRLLYVLGFILIFGAGILLVTKKRMDTK